MHPLPPPSASSESSGAPIGAAAVAAAAHKYGQQPGGDTLSDFVTLVCQEASNAAAVSRYVVSGKKRGCEGKG